MLEFNKGVMYFSPMVINTEIMLRNHLPIQMCSVDERNLCFTQVEAQMRNSHIPNSSSQPKCV